MHSPMHKASPKEQSPNYAPALPSLMTPSCHDLKEKATEIPCAPGRVDAQFCVAPSGGTVYGSDVTPRVELPMLNRVQRDKEEI